MAYELPRTLSPSKVAYMSLERVAEVASTGVNFISVGALTHSAPAFDLSMRL
jgi:nicotinate-nucleotide pyrophosphorylase